MFVKELGNTAGVPSVYTLPDSLRLYQKSIGPQRKTPPDCLPKT